MTTVVARRLVAGLACVAFLAAACGGDDDGDVGGGPDTDTGTGAGTGTGADTGTTAALQVSSDAWTADGTVPIGHTCEGADQPPDVAWSDAPEGTVSYAITLRDPDAPGGTFDHWGVHGLPADVTELPADADVSELGGQLVTTDFDEASYRGPCPPEGDEPHRYVLRVLALDTELELPEDASVEDLLEAASGHVLAEGRVTARFGR